MLRPEQMSKISVTGSRRVMGDVVEAIHDQSLVHMTEYDGGWEGFDPGESTATAEAAADKLVTVRSLISQLGVEPSDAGPSRIVTDEALEAELEEVRVEANELDDRREDLRDDLRRVNERIDTVEPFVDVGVDIDLLSGYDSLQVTVGEGQESAVREAVTHATDLDEFDIFAGEEYLAVFARPTPSADEDALADTLVGAEFAAVEVPELDETEKTAPEAYHQSLEADREELRTEIETVDREIETLREEWAGFLLAAEEELSIRVGKAEAPLSFATTENAFVAEGWIPTEEYTEFAGAISDAVGNSAEVEELERASFGSDGAVQVREDVPQSVQDAGTDETDGDRAEAEEEEPQRAVADGGAPVVMRDDDPPTIQDNPGIAKPFELLTGLVGEPNYREFDPTIVLFLTFPVMFGFMIGDFAYGLIYTAIGAYLYSGFDSDSFQAAGAVAMIAGVSTAIFGILYGEIFGLHLIASEFWEGIVGLKHAPIEKGLEPAGSYWARTWLVVSVVFGVLHLNVAWIFDFLENLEFHGFVEALEESGSWLLALNGLWLFLFSTWFGRTPPILFEVFSSGKAAAFELGFTGFPVIVGQIGAVMMGLGVLLIIVGPTAEIVEIFTVLSHTLSYLRIGAVLVAKAGMAFAVNLLFFGVYETGEGGETAWHFALTKMPEVGATYHGHEVTGILFGGMAHGGPVLLVAGVLVLIAGHLLVLALGVTSSGIQAIRLEYFEFFSKFYDGDGITYDPFGTERTFTSEE
ncbi:V-type ATP synthase subunit I [Halobaculum sp. MBLA0143]|uniref:V-type ATP synthase subunit I n=1 Tax=Halobaculum sp. MBLA0143 TaxID=3079933 RepID=UPI003524E418